MNNRKIKFYINDDYDDNLYDLSLLKQKGISISDYINKALRYYKSLENKIVESIFPPMDQYLDKKINGSDACYEIPRLLERGGDAIIETCVKAYIGAKSFVIQIENTKVIKDLLELEDNGMTIYSKRDSLSSIILDKAKGNLVDGLKKSFSKKEVDRLKKLEKEKQINERKQWTLDHPDIPYHMRNFSQERREFELALEKGEIKLDDCPELYDDDTNELD